MIRRLLLAIGLVVPALAGPAAAPNDHWPQFRGPSAGVAENDPALPERWSATENVAWTLDVPGVGWSSPVVWGDHVFVTPVVNTRPAGGAQARAVLRRRAARVNGAASLDGARRRLRDRQGALVEGQCAAARPPEPRHLKNSYASETPVTDGERVYFYFGNVGLFAFDMKGTPVWSKPLGPFKTRNGWGTAASPVLHRDRIYIVNDNDEQSFLAAYDKRTGRGDLAGEPRRGHQLGDAVRLGARAAAPRSSRRAPTGCARTT